MTAQTFVFFGQVGSGKGTQVKLLSEYLVNKGEKMPLYAGTGEEFRKLINSDNYAADQIKGLLQKGQLVPDVITNCIFTGLFVFYLKRGDHAITDGYPRTVGQSEVFEKLMNFYDRKDVKIIYIKVSKDEALKRNKLRGRADDTDEGLAKRFEEYENNVVPAMNYFAGKEGYIIYEINGEQSVEDVHQEIISKLGF